MTTDFFDALKQEAPATEQPAQVNEEVTVPQKRTRSTKEFTDELLDYVLKNIKNYSYQELADKTGLTKSQITGRIADIKKGIRQRVIDKAKERGESAYATKMAKGRNGKPDYEVNDYSKPLTSEAAAVEKMIKEKLSRPENSRPGSGNSKTRQMVNTKVDEFLKGLNI
jgi:hypothetical protein